MEKRAPVRLMIVEDSNFMRKAIAKLVGEDERIEVVSLVGSGEEALRVLHETSPDIITLDFELPGMNGLETLEEIMRLRPTPVIMFSAYTRKGADLTLKALRSGAVDFIQKPSGVISMDLSRVRDELLEKVVTASDIRGRDRNFCAAVSRTGGKSDGRQPLKQLTALNQSLLFLASSTGGVQALTKLIPNLPGDFPLPVVIVQHMPPMFTASLAESLGRVSRLKVKEAEEGDLLKPGTVYISPGGWHTRIRKNGKGPEITLSREPDIRLKPCADITMESLVDTYGENVVSVVLTGMGEDGTKGAAALRKKGGIVIAQDEATSLIFGMPGSIVKNGLADAVWPIDEMAGNIVSLLKS